MSDNRFSASLTPLQVMIRYGNIYIGDNYTFDERTAIATDALARIAELSPRTVDEVGRERAREVTYDWWLNTTGMSRANADQLVDRIIDALGWTVAPQPKQEVARDYFDTLVVPAPADAPHQCADVQDDCCERTPAPVSPAPVVELPVEFTLDACASVYDVLARVAHLARWTPDYKAGIAVAERKIAKLTSKPVVELDADELRGVADALEGLDNYADGLTIGKKDGGWVLRIGGTDE